MANSNSIVKRYLDFMNKQIMYINDNMTDKMACQRVAFNVNKITRRRDKLGMLASEVYNATLREFPNLGTIMDKVSFVAAGATKADIVRMEQSGDYFFINRNGDGSTPSILSNEDSLDHLEKYEKIASDMI